MIASARRDNYLRPLLRIAWIQRQIKASITKKVKSPSEQAHARQPTFVCGEAVNLRGESKCARILTSNGYSLTITGSLAVVDYLMRFNPGRGGLHTSQTDGGQTWSADCRTQVL